MSHEFLQPLVYLTYLGSYERRCKKSRAPRCKIVRRLGQSKLYDVGLCPTNLYFSNARNRGLLLTSYNPLSYSTLLCMTSSQQLDYSRSPARYEKFRCEIRQEFRKKVRKPRYAIHSIVPHRETSCGQLVFWLWMAEVHKRSTKYATNLT